MSKRASWMTAVGLVGMAAVLCSPAWAQEAGASASGTSDTADIIVTANKREQSLADVGLTIKALGGEALDRQRVTSLVDLATAVPGLTFSQTEQSTPVYTLRGVGFYDTSLASYPTVTVYVDQAPLPSPAMTTLAIFDLERVEVLKGPQGILFGNNATGGAINYVAAKPTSNLSAGLTATYGRFSTVELEGYVSGPVSPTLSARAAFRASRGSGYQVSASRPEDRNGAPDTLAGRILLDWQPSDRFRVQVNLNGWRDRTEPSAGQFVLYTPNFAPVPRGGPFVPNARDDNRVADWSPDTPPRADNRLYQGVLRADYDLTDDIALTTLSSYADYKHDQRPEGDGVSRHRQDILYNRGYFKSFFQELRLANDASPTFRWVLGANYSSDRVFEDNYVNFQDGTVAVALAGWRGNGFNTRQNMKNYAVFANGEYTLGDITFKAGARYTKSERTTRACVYSPFNPAVDGPDPEPAFFTAQSNRLSGRNNPVPAPGECFNVLPVTFLQGPFVGQLNQDNLSWRVGVDWKVTEDVLAYFNVAKGYKAGVFPTISGNGNYSPVVQESVMSYEGGIKAQLLNRALNVNLAAFYYDYTDKQLKSKRIDQVFGPLDGLVNIPESSIKGAELEIQIRPGRGLTIGGAVTYLDAMIDRFTGVSGTGLVANFDNTRIPYTPKWQLAGNANYEFSISSNVEGFVGGQVSYRSATNSAIGYPAGFTLPAYTLLDLQAGLEIDNGRYRVMVWGKNVTDQFYITNYFTAVVDGVSRYVGRPATYGATVSLRF